MIEGVCLLSLSEDLCIDQGFQETLKKIKELPLRGKDGKLRGAEFVSREGLLRIVQNIPSPLAEKVYLWLAQLGEEKLLEVEQQTQAEQLRDFYIRQLERGIDLPGVSYVIP